MAILSCEPTNIRLAGLLEEEAYKHSTLAKHRALNALTISITTIQ